MPQSIYTIRTTNGAELKIEAASPEEALAAASQWEGDNPNWAPAPAQPPAPQAPANPGLMAGLGDFGQSIVAGAQRLRTQPEAWGNISEGLREGGIEEYPVFGPMVAPVVDVLSGLGERVFGDPTPDRWDRRMAADWAQAGREGVEAAYAAQSAARQFERANDPWHTPQNLLHLGGEQLPNLAIAALGGGVGAGAGLTGTGAAGVMAGLEGLQGMGQINEGIVQELMSRGFSRDDAIREAALPSMGGGLGTALVGRALGGFEADLLSGLATRGVVRGAARGMVSEGVEEALQSGQEQLFHNLGVRGLDPTQNLLEGVGEAALQGGVLGGLMGGTIGGVSGYGEQNQIAQGRARDQLTEDLDLRAQEGMENAERAQAIRAARQQATQAPAPIAGSLTDQSAPGLQVPPTPGFIRDAVDQVTWREQVAPVLDQMAQGNYETLLQEQQDQLGRIDKARAQKKRKPQPYPDPIPPRPESQLKADPFTPEVGAELIRTAEAGPMTPSMLKHKGVPKPQQTLDILERRGFIRKTGEAPRTVQMKNGKTRETMEPVYESTALKPREYARAGETAELAIRPIAAPAAPGATQGASAKAIAERSARARERVADLRRQLVSLPQVGEDWPQSRIDATDSRRSALEERLAQAEFDAARADTGRAEFAVVERISGPKLTGQQGLDFTADPTGRVRENLVQTFPTRKEAEAYLKAKQGQSEAPTAPEPKTAGRNARIEKALQARLKGLGLSDKAALRISEELGVMEGGDMVDPEGYAETLERDAEGRSTKMLVALARDIYDPSLTDNELVDKLAQTLDHEGIHALRSLGLFTPEEWNVLAREVRSRKKAGRDYTYLQQAFETYKDLPSYQNDKGEPNMDLIVEEAVAEMFRDWRVDGGKINARYTGLLNKIANFFRQLLGRLRAGDVMKRVDEGQVGARETRQDERTIPADKLYLFGGERAKTADKEALTTAKLLEEDGVEREAIRKQTGWFRGDDGKWRYEINDRDVMFREEAQLKRKFFGGVKMLDNAIDWIERGLAGHDYSQRTLGTVIDHPELFAAYPKLADLPVLVDRPYHAMGATTYSPWTGKADAIVIGGGSRRWLHDKDLFDDQVMSVLLHEAQHAVQDQEDFARGEASANGADAYRRASGEIEARNVQARRDWTDTERWAMSPDDSRDVPFEEAIVNGRDPLRRAASEAHDADVAGPPGVPSDRRFMFLGGKSKTVPVDNYNDYAEATLDGEPLAKIYESTGWYQGTDGEDRYEISDAPAKLLMAQEELAGVNTYDREFDKLEAVMSHDELYAAYPLARELIVVRDDSLGTGNARLIDTSFSRAQMGVVLGPMTSDQQMKTSILHEVQHYIQQFEDWAYGGSPDNAPYYIKYNERARRNFERFKAEMVKSAKGTMSMSEWAKFIGYRKDLTEQDKDNLWALRDVLHQGIENVPPVLAKSAAKAVNKSALHYVYESLAGEIESRNVEERIAMTEKDLRRTAPWRTADMGKNIGVVLRLSDMETLLSHASAIDHKRRRAEEPTLKDEALYSDVRFSMAPRKRGDHVGAMPSSAPTQSKAGRDASQIAARYTVVQDYLSGGARTNAWARDHLDRATTLMQDRMQPVRRMVSDVMRYGGAISDEADPVLADTLYPRRSQHRLEKAHGNLYRPAYLATQQIGATKTDLGKLALISDAAKAELESSHVHPSQALLNIYLYARHAPERNAFIEQVRQAKKIDPETGIETDEALDAGSGMSNEEAQRIMDWFARYPKLAKVQVAAAKVDAILDYTRSVREQSGLSPGWGEIDSRLVPQFKHYVPLRGEAAGNMVEDLRGDDMHARTGKAYKIRGREDPRMKGRQTYAGDMLANVVLQNQEAIVRSEKVKVGQAVAAFVRKNPELTDDFLVELPALPKGRSVDSRTGKVRVTTKMGVADDPNYYVTKENGKDVIFEVKDPRVGRALSHIQTFDDGPVGKVLSKVIRLTRLMSQLQTSFNPEFLVPNFLRDVQTAMIQSGEYDDKAWASIGAKATTYAGRALKMRLGAPDPEMAAKLDKLSDQGGLTGVYGLTSIEDQINSINKELDDIEPGQQTTSQKAWKATAKTIGWGFNQLEKINDTVESATRLAVYESFLERGFSEARAAQMAKDMTVNFNRKGEWGPYMNAAYMFFNAATQGSATMLKALSSKKVQKVTIGIVIAGALQELLMDALSPEDEYGTKAYDKIEDHILEKNMVFMLGDDGSYLKIPMPLGYNIFHNAGRRLTRTFMGKDKPLQAALGMGSSTLSAFNPFGNNGNILSMFTPSIARPVTEIVTNQDFTGQSIHPEGFPGLQQPASQEAFGQASEMSKGAADLLSRLTGGDGAYIPGKLEIHPDDLDHLTGAYLGGLGRFLGRANNLLGFATDPQSKAVQGRELRARDVPFYRSFAGNVSGSSVRGAYDQLITPYLQFGKSFDQFEEEGNGQAMQSMLERDGDRLAIYDMVADTERDRIKLRREIHDIQEDPMIPNESKAPILKQLRDEEQAMMNMTIRDVRTLEDQLGL